MYGTSCMAGRISNRLKSKSRSKEETVGRNETHYSLLWEWDLESILLLEDAQAIPTRPFDKEK